ncbi:MAG: PIN domain-containing protein [Rhodobacteraceae bacterium]|nr:MAG: PIN domain-containing protein [Paracoccaceae bacterium]
MRLVLDACVLFPERLRRVLLAYAEAGGFAPLWSDRILGEWARAAEARLGPVAAALAREEAAALGRRFPNARVTGWEALEDAAGLPDPADAHVIAAARAAGADGIVTLNARDFPLRALGAAGLARVDPDAFLRAEYAPAGLLAETLAAVAASERTDDFAHWIKKAGLPRLAKALRT